MIRRWLGLLSLAPAVVLLLPLGCAVGPDYEGPPDVQKPAEWSGELRGGLTSADLDPDALATWWRNLDDPILDDLVESAIDANLDLRTAEAQLRQARAERGLTGANRFPTIGSRAQAQKQRAAVTEGQSVEIYSGGFDSSWEVDVFGGLQRAVEASDADLQVAEEFRRDVLVSVVAEVAINYIELRTFQLRYEVAKRHPRLAAVTKSRLSGSSTRLTSA